MIIKSFPSGPFATNAYIVECPETPAAAIIDPGVDSATALINYIDSKGLQVEKILLTHSHWDHIGDVADLKRRFKISVYVHTLDTANLENPGADGLPFPGTIEGVKADGTFSEGDRIKVGTLTWEVIHTPGHTPGGVSFYCDHPPTLISGDTLFKGSIGNISFPGSSSEDMWDSLEKLGKLPSETIVYPGHGPQTTIGDESWLPNARQIFG